MLIIKSRVVVKFPFHLSSILFSINAMRVFL